MVRVLLAEEGQHRATEIDSGAGPQDGALHRSAIDTGLCVNAEWLDHELVRIIMEDLGVQQLQASQLDVTVIS